ncbi:MAG: galactokinase [Burkholderiaceae bacterium]|nr:galactokinase [Burkholderiaceae bacterium]
MNTLFDRADALLRRTLGRSTDGLAFAPGRVNLIGEHTDYNGGFVLPCAIQLGTGVAWAARDDDLVRVVRSDPQEDVAEFRLSDRLGAGPGTGRTGGPPWWAYVQGMMLAMRQAHGLSLGGLDIALAGDLPMGAGLSSSASLCVAVGQACAASAAFEMPRTHLALAAQRAENDFVGCRCGNMDQMASTHGQAGKALLIDCRALSVQPISMPPGLAILVVHSGVERGLVDSAYNERRASCDRAAALLGLGSLRDATTDLLADPRLDALALQRARHVVTENERVLAAAQALQTGDLRTLRECMAASHRSMRDDFAITVSAVDRLADLMHTAIGAEGGARMTGGGFGGCVVGLVPEDRLNALDQAVAAGYRDPHGSPPRRWRLRASTGVSLG